MAKIDEIKEDTVLDKINKRFDQIDRQQWLFDLLCKQQ